MDDVIKLGAIGPHVLELQQGLQEKGFSVGEIDGIFGLQTLAAVKKFQAAKGLVADGIVGNMTQRALKGEPVTHYDTTTVPGQSIIDLPLSSDQYIRSAFDKKQIVLHHTAGGPDPSSTFQWFNGNAERVAVAYIVGGGPDSPFDGQIIRCFDDKYWAYHLGANNYHLESEAVAIEICNWGFLTKGSDKKYYNVYGDAVSSDEVVDLGFKWRGFQYFHRYTNKQIAVVKALVLAMAKKYSIPLVGTYTKEAGWFDISQKALSGTPGLWNHTNFRTDKTDLSPQPAMIEMLNSLKTAQPV